MLVLVLVVVVVVVVVPLAAAALRRARLAALAVCVPLTLLLLSCLLLRLKSLGCCHRAPAAHRQEKGVGAGEHSMRGCNPAAGQRLEGSGQVPFCEASQRLGGQPHLCWPSMFSLLTSACREEGTAGVRCSLEPCISPGCASHHPGPSALLARGGAVKAHAPACCPGQALWRAPERRAVWVNTLQARACLRLLAKQLVDGHRAVGALDDLRGQRGAAAQAVCAGGHGQRHCLAAQRQRRAAPGTWAHARVPARYGAPSLAAG